MLVGDIYGDRDYSSIGLSATTIASSFGKVVSQVDKLLSIWALMVTQSGQCMLKSWRASCYSWKWYRPKAQRATGASK